MFTNAIAKDAKKALDWVNKYDFINDFYLAGGTALAIQLGHRVSVDLDFFIQKEFNPENLLQEFNKAKIEISQVTFEKNTLYGFIQKTQLSVMYYPYSLLEEFVNYEGINLASILDIALMKLTAIMSRGSKKDFVDLFYILKEYSFDELMHNFDIKYKDTDFNVYHIMKSLVFFNDADQDPDPKMLKDFNWEEIKEFFQNLITK